MDSETEVSSESAEVTITFKEYDDFDYLRDNLKNLLYSPQFCGVCLETTDLCGVEAEFEVATCWKTGVKALKDIVDYVFSGQVNEVLASAFMCSACTDKVLESYIFIYNSRQSSKVINNCINELNFRAVSATEQLSGNENYENSEVLMILENNDTLYPQQTHKAVPLKNNWDNPYF